MEYEEFVSLDQDGLKRFVEENPVDPTFALNVLIEVDGAFVDGILVGEKADFLTNFPHSNDNGYAMVFEYTVNGRRVLCTNFGGPVWKTNYDVHPELRIYPVSSEVIEIDHKDRVYSAIRSFVFDGGESL